MGIGGKTSGHSPLTAMTFRATLPVNYYGPEAFYQVTATLELPTITATFSAVYHASSADSARQAFQSRNRGAVILSVEECPAP
jgi:hypothetical protein